MWEYCILAKFDLDENPGILDDGDKNADGRFQNITGFLFETQHTQSQ